MSIVTLKKVTLFGLCNDKPALLESLQEMGGLHLESLRPARAHPEEAPPEHAEDAYKALRYLKDSPRRRRRVTEDHDFDVDAFIAKVLANQQRKRDTADRRDFVAERIKQLSLWGNFELPGEGGLRGYLLWFYIIPLRQLDQIQEEELIWQIVHRDNRFAYVVVIAKDEPAPNTMPVGRTHTGAKPLRALQRELDSLEDELETIAADREALTRGTFLLESRLALAEDRASLRYAGDLTLETPDGILALQGWAAEKDVPALHDFAGGQGLALMAEDPGPDDTPPTLLHNPPDLSGGEDLLKFYQTPGYRAWDPSTIMFFSFALFFGMILADAGYATLLGVFLACYWKRLGASATGQRMRVLLAWLLGSTLVYGILVGSYFGLAPPESSLLGKLNIVDLNNYGAMMRLSIIIGGLHLAMANAMRAYYGRSRAERGQPLGWCAAVFGGLFIWLGLEGEGALALLGFLGKVLLLGGLVAVFWFADAQPVHSVKDALRRLANGLLALSNVSKIFGDVLSYMRLFALGLSSASLAITFNDLAGQAAEAVPGIGFLLAILIVILGHTINIGLSIMSGVVHGLRLNVLEFLNWSVSEEGYPFQSFAKKEVSQ